MKENDRNPTPRDTNDGQRMAEGGSVQEGVWDQTRQASAGASKLRVPVRVGRVESLRLRGLTS
jgi:uncharacterized protein with FMN-binding domain